MSVKKQPKKQWGVLIDADLVDQVRAWTLTQPIQPSIRAALHYLIQQGLAEEQKRQYAGLPDLPN